MRFRGQVQDICQWIDCCPLLQADKLLAPQMKVHFILEVIKMDNAVVQDDVIPGVMKILKALIDWEMFAPGRVNVKINFPSTKSTIHMVRGGVLLESSHLMKAAWEQGRITVRHPVFSEINNVCQTAL